VLAPFEYTALIAGAVAGYLIWEEVPDRWVVTGALVIIASGLYIVYREVGTAASMRYLRALTASGSALLSRRRRAAQKPRT
jgi:drug/metabolite transporter (DMT)-like permease